jgi:multidrug resistance protein, MATE family
MTHFGGHFAFQFSTFTGYSIGFGLASALDTLCSQAFGARRLDKIGIYFQSGLLVIGVCSIPIAFVNWYSSAFLVLLHQDPRIAELAQVYSRYNLLGMPFVFLYELQRKALQAQGIMTPLVGIAALGNLVQIVAGYIFAYHTAWGFAGVALGRSLGNISLVCFLRFYFRIRPDHLHQWWNGWHLRDAVRHVSLFLQLGLPGMLMLAMEWWAFEIMSLMAGWLPDPVVAMSVQSVQINVTSLFYMCFVGFSVAANIRVGNHLGAGLPRRARAVMLLTTQVVAVMGLCFGGVILTCRSWIAGLFVNDPVTIASASGLLAMWAPMECIEGLNCLMQGIFRGVGCQDVAARINMVTFYVVGTPLAYLVGFRAHWGVEGLWLGFGVAVSLSAATLSITSSRWNWRALSNDAKRRTAQ